MHAEGESGYTVADNVLIEVTEILLVVAGLVCVGKLIHIGIKYMMTAAADKSDAKMALVPWLVGTIVCFGAAWLGGSIIEIISGSNANKPVLSY